MTILAQCDHPLSIPELIEYQSGELSSERAEAIEQHYFSCVSCTRRLSQLDWLREQVGGSVALGTVRAAVSGHFLAESERRGLRIRKYRLGPSTSVECTAAPDDDFVAICLDVDASRAESVDLKVSWEAENGAQEREEIRKGLPCDSTAGQLILLSPAAEVRAYPKSRWVMNLTIYEAGATRALGPYSLHHTPWEELPERPSAPP